MKTNGMRKVLRPVAGASLVALALVLGGCRPDEAVAPPSTRAEPSAPVSTQALAAAKFVTGASDPSEGRPQPRLPTLKLWVGTNEVTAELAATDRQIAIGMMRRTSMAEMDGMLFLFARPGQRAFYMRNTLVPLSCAYIDPEGTILEIYDMKPLDETPIPSKSDQVQYVLEMNQGWFERHGVKPGVAVSTERGTFPQTFRRR
jgi:uncharacterized protein